MIMLPFLKLSLRKDCNEFSEPQIIDPLTFSLLCDAMQNDERISTAIEFDFENQFVSVYDRGSEEWNVYDLADVVSRKFDKQAALDIYNAQGTQDYYVFGPVNQKDFDSDISVFNPAKEKIDTNIIRIENTDFIYFWLPDFSNGYYLRINSEEIALSD